MKAITFACRLLAAAALLAGVASCNSDDPVERQDSQLFNEGGLLTQSMDTDGEQTTLQGVSYKVTWYWDRGTADVTVQGLVLGGGEMPPLTVNSVPFKVESDGTRTISGSNLSTTVNGAPFTTVFRSLTFKAIDRVSDDDLLIYPMSTLPNFMPSIYVNIKVDDQVVTSVPRLLYYFAKTSAGPVDAPEQTIYNADYLPVRVELMPGTMTANVQIFRTRLYMAQPMMYNVEIGDIPFTSAGEVITFDGGDKTFYAKRFESVTYQQASGTFTLNGVKTMDELPLTSLGGTAKAVGRMRLTFTATPADGSGASAFACDGYLLPQD